MRYRALVIAAVVITFGLHHMASSSERMRSESILGTSYLAAEAAISEFKKTGLQIEDYMINVVERSDYFIVLFSDPKATPGQRGSSVTMVGFEVELTKEYQVIRSQYSD